MIFRISKSADTAGFGGFSVPPGMRVYAIGDIHGRADLLDAIASQIENELPSAPRRVVTVLLGDYVDRGLRSAEVLDRLSKGDFPTEFIALRGNHEQFMLDALEDQSAFDSWRRYGGLETLASYQVDVSGVMRGRDFVRAREELIQKVPAAHRAFLASLPSSHEIGDFFFCHAGVRPGLPLRKQQEDDLMWIRHGFLSSIEFHGKIVIHGHTPVEAADFRSNRINIDTGAYLTNRLSCLILEGSTRRLIHT
ncbi:metallophosphoesterase family protein [Rhodoblastus sp.]|uniref:metallophosphoesterase family protein n=1 Tax=Rhodoblastus sp. TaxID=1962975 RepID=UPI0035AE42F3